jgi:hypothetical protein
MTTALRIPLDRQRVPRGRVATIAIGLIASAVVFGLLISGVTFLAMAVAFEIAIPIAQHYDVSVSAGDMALAGRLAELWWIPAIVAAVSFVGAAVVAVLAVRHLDTARGA